MRTKIIYLLLLLAFSVNQKSLAQCSTTAGPSYSSSCTAEYFTSTSATGTGVTSTISAGFGSCSGTYFNYYSSQGISAPAGTTVTFHMTRPTTYTAYLTVYVDWNNDGTYTATELAGSMMTLTAGVGTAAYNFTIPTTGVVITTNLHMRAMLSESVAGAPCSATWGQSLDFYCYVTCASPTITASASAAGFCSGGTGVSLTATGAGAGGTYSWSPATGLSATTGTTVTATPGTTTTYTVTGTTSIGCINTGTVTATVYPLPTTTITASGPLSFCAGDSVTLSAPGTAGYTYQWLHGGVPIAGATNMTYVANTSGNYRVTVTSAMGCTATSAATIVTVNTAPSSVITPAGATTFCAGGSVVLSGTPVAGATYQWSNGGTVIAGATNVTYTASTTGTYSLTITGATGCASTSIAAITVTVNPLPVITVTPSGATTFCAGTAFTLSATAVAGYSYQWHSGAGSIPGATNSTYSPTASGTYFVFVTNAATGCSSTSTSTTVTVNPLPVAGITNAFGSSSYCAGGSITLNATVGAGFMYQWYLGGVAIAGAVTNSYVATAPGNYTVAIVSASGCATTSASYLVTELALPTIIPGGDTIFCGGSNVLLHISTGSATGINYQWQLNGSNITGATNSTFTATATGLYTCNVNIPGSCSVTVGPIHIMVHPAPTPVIVRSGSSLSTVGTYVHYQWLLNTNVMPGDTTRTIIVHWNSIYNVLVTDSNGCQTLSNPYNLNTLKVSSYLAESISIYPNPANNYLEIESPIAINATILGTDGRTIASYKDAKHVDISNLNNGVYMVVLFDEEGSRLKVEKLIKE